MYTLNKTINMRIYDVGVNTLDIEKYIEYIYS